MHNFNSLSTECNHNPCTCLDEEAMLEVLKVARECGHESGKFYEKRLEDYENDIKQKNIDEKPKNDMVYKMFKKRKIPDDLTPVEKKFFDFPKTNEKINEHKVVRNENLDKYVISRVICCPDVNDITIYIPGTKLVKEHYHIFDRDSNGNLASHSSHIVNIGTKNVTLLDFSEGEFVKFYTHELIGESFLLKPGEDVILCKMINGVVVK